jgi:hypothetical protein
MIDILCNDDNKIMVKITNIELFPVVTETKYRQNKEGDCYIQATVGWNPLVGSNIVDNNGNLTGEKQSPVTLLLHELGHILAIWFDSEGDFYDLETRSSYFHNEAERKVVQGVESSAARYWGEGLRENHWIKTDESVYYCTTDPTSNQKLRPEKEIEP